MNVKVVIIIATIVLNCGNLFALTITKVREWGTGYYNDIFIQENYAYCAASGAGLDVIDISIPTAP